MSKVWGLEEQMFVACERRLFWWGDCDECERGGAKGFGNGLLYIHNFLENDFGGGLPAF